MIIPRTKTRATLIGALASALLVSLLAPPPHAVAADGVTANEAKCMGISTLWRENRGLVTKGADGKVLFLYGEVQPSVVCSPLQVCDIELQGGEVVRDVLVGDTVRWKVEPATSGAAGGQAIHLIVKPSEPGRDFNGRDNIAAHLPYLLISTEN